MSSYIVNGKNTNNINSNYLPNTGTPASSGTNNPAMWLDLGRILNGSNNKNCTGPNCDKNTTENYLTGANYGQTQDQNSTNFNNYLNDIKALEEALKVLTENNPNTLFAGGTDKVLNTEDEGLYSSNTDGSSYGTDTNSGISNSGETNNSQGTSSDQTSSTGQMNFPQFAQYLSMLSNLINMLLAKIQGIDNNLLGTASASPSNDGNYSSGSAGNGSSRNTGVSSKKSSGHKHHHNNETSSSKSSGNGSYNNTGVSSSGSSGNNYSHSSEVSSGNSSGSSSYNSTGNYSSGSSDNNTVTKTSTSGRTGTNSGTGKVNAQIDFEDGKFPGTAPNSKEPAKIMTDSNGNKFLRLTANYGDQEGVPSAYNNRVRSTMYMAGEHWNMPELNNSNNHMSYSADIRFIDNKDTRGYSNNSFFELFQGSSTHASTGYNANNSAGGPPARLIRKDDGTVCFQTTQETGAGKPRKVVQYDLGYFGPNEFHNFKVDAVWSKDSSIGGYKVSVDGEEKLNIKGSTYYNPSKSNLVPALKCGLYGSNAVGSVDIDNVEVDNLNS